MLNISIKPKGFEEAAKALKHLGKTAFPRAASEAMNRGLVAGRKLAIQLIRARYNIQSGVLKAKGMELERATYRSLQGEVRAKGPMLPVSLFSPSVKRKQIKGSRRNPIKAQFVTVKILRSGGRKLIKGAFQAKGRIWERRGPARDAPIGIVSTIGVPSMVAYLGIANKVEKAIAQATAERLQHNIAFELSKAKR